MPVEISKKVEQQYILIIFLAKRAQNQPMFAEDLEYNLAVVCCQKHGCTNTVVHSRTAISYM